MCVSGGKVWHIYFKIQRTVEFVYIENGENVGKTEVCDDHEDDPVDVHDVVLVVIIVCFQVNQS